jgi:TM2 domain-containing membrane protein YozV
MKRVMLLTFLVSVQFIYAQNKFSLLNDLGVLKKSKTKTISMFNNLNYPLQAEDNKKSVTLAVVFSLLLPGMGELYVGDYSTGKYLTAAEGGLWLTYTSFELYGTWVKNDARKFAVSNAGVTIAGQNDQFFVDIGNYHDVYQFNERKLQERQLPEKLYDPNSVYAWSWNNDGARQKYKNLRISSDQAFNSRQYVIGAVIANHVISAVNAARLAIFHNSNVDNSQTLNIGAQLLGTIYNPHGIAVKISKIF